MWFADSSANTISKSMLSRTFSESIDPCTKPVSMTCQSVRWTNRVCTWSVKLNGRVQHRYNRHILTLSFVTAIHVIIAATYNGSFPVKSNVRCSVLLVIAALYSTKKNSPATKKYLGHYTRKYVSDPRGLKQSQGDFMQRPTRPFLVIGLRI